MKPPLWKLAKQVPKPCLLGDMVHVESVRSMLNYENDESKSDRGLEILAIMEESSRQVHTYARELPHPRQNILGHNVAMESLCRQLRVLIGGMHCKKCKRLMPTSGHPICEDCYSEWLMTRPVQPTREQYAEDMVDDYDDREGED